MLKVSTFFQVVALEPLDEPTLRVNCNNTSLVLGGSVASAIPPDFFLETSRECIPLQIDTVNILGSIIAPIICPSVLSSKFRVAILLHGPTGCWSRFAAVSFAVGYKFTWICCKFDYLYRVWKTNCG